jgi:hypothetical protein
MPPQRAESSSKRKPTAFKPPRPVTKNKNSGGKQSDTRDLSSSDSELVPDDSDHSPAAKPSKKKSSTSDEAVLTIPPGLLLNILNYHHGDGKLQIKDDAKSVVAKYIDTFVREAIARAAFERSEATANGDAAKDFLEVCSTKHGWVR